MRRPAALTGRRISHRDQPWIRIAFRSVRRIDGTTAHVAGLDVALARMRDAEQDDLAELVEVRRQDVPATPVGTARIASPGSAPAKLMFAKPTRVPAAMEAASVEPDTTDQRSVPCRAAGFDARVQVAAREDTPRGHLVAAWSEWLAPAE